MYYIKKIILQNANKVATGILTISRDERGAKVSIANKIEGCERTIIAEGTHYVVFPPPPFSGSFPYSGGELECACVLKNKILSSGTLSGKREFSGVFHALRETEKPTKIETPKTEDIGREVSEPSTTTDTLENDEFSPEDDPIEEKEDFVKDEEDTLSSTSEENDEKNVAEFYCSIKKNLDETFTCYPEDKVLSTLIPDSTWAQVTRESEKYVVGLIRENGKPRYVCYGVPGVPGLVPPDEMKKYCQWLPTTADERDGYWIVFQDAYTGKTLSEE